MGKYDIMDEKHENNLIVTATPYYCDECGLRFLDLGRLCAHTQIVGHRADLRDVPTA